MTTYKNFEDLPICISSKHLATEFFKRIIEDKICVNYSLKDQMAKSIISVSSNIAEGFERGSKKELIQFLYIARGSLGEFRSQAQIAKGANFLSEVNFKYLFNSSYNLSKQINGFIEYLKSSSIKGQKYKKVLI